MWNFWVGIVGIVSALMGWKWAKFKWLEFEKLLFVQTDHPAIDFMCASLSNLLWLFEAEQEWQQPEDYDDELGNEHVKRNWSASVPQEVANVYHGGGRTPSFTISLSIWFSATMKLLTWEIWQLPVYHPLTRNYQPTLDVEHSKHSPAAWCQSGCSAKDGEGKWLGRFTSPTDTGRNRVSKPLWSNFKHGFGGFNPTSMFIGCFIYIYIYIYIYNTCII